MRHRALTPEKMERKKKRFKVLHLFRLITVFNARGNKSFISTFYLPFVNNSFVYVICFNICKYVF